MRVSIDQVHELKKLFYGVKVSLLEEGALTYVLIRGVIPPGQDAEVDLLLCPMERDGYPSRLFVSRRISAPSGRNWNANGVRIGEKEWHAISWRVSAGLTLAEMLLAHLRAFK